LDLKKRETAAHYPIDIVLCILRLLLLRIDDKTIRSIKKSMKPVGSFSKLAACGISLAAVFVVCSAQAATGTAVVRTAQGTASYAERAGEWQSLRVGQVLRPGAVVRTGVDSRVQLFLDDNGPDVRLFESTTLGLDRLQIEQTGTGADIETQLNLTAGTIEGTVRRLTPASRYEVKTPNAVIGVGRTTAQTVYQISANGVTHVRSGQMVVVYINPATGEMSTHTVSAGQSFYPPVGPDLPPTVRALDTGVWIPWTDLIDDAGRVVTVPQTEVFVSPIR
jgi:hypothetical protein